MNDGPAPTDPTRDAGSAGPVPIGLALASTLCWLWGAVVGILGAVAILPPVVRHGTRDLPIVLAALLLLVGGYCWAGYALRRRRRSGVVTGGAAAVVWSLALLSFPAPETLVSLVVNVAIVALIAASRRQFATRTNDRTR